MGSSHIDGISPYSWTEVKKSHEKAYTDLDTFFEELYQKAVDETTGISISYRESQHRFASTVMEAIKDRKILLIEAGVGTGKSMGYLIPIFYTWKNVRSFGKIVISTSSMALQDQLMKDIDYVSKLLGITIKGAVARGINNYACLKRIEQKMLKSVEHKDQDTYNKLLELKKQMYIANSCEKTKLQSFRNDLWQEIRVCGGCGHCEYRTECMFLESKMLADNATIVVTNHAHLSNMLKNETSAVENADLVVIDEAHKLEEELRLANQGTLNFTALKRDLNDIRAVLKYNDYDFDYELGEFTRIYQNIGAKLIDFAVALRRNVKSTFRKQSNNNRQKINDIEKLSFNIENEGIQDALRELNKELKKMLKLLNSLPKMRAIEKVLGKVKESIAVFEDIEKGRYSKFVYWARFIDKEKVEIIYTLKDLTPFYARLFDRDKPVVFTSATITTDQNYDVFASSLRDEDKLRIMEETPIASPFDYEHNSLFYYDPKAPNPNSEDYVDYIEGLAFRISDLIKITGGKSLILFTSKVDMIAVYELVKSLNPELDLILQEGSSTANYINKFSENENSCLFATGAFWEGVDFPGKTLSNLIIARLPFPVQDPIVEYKKSKLPRKESFSVDLNEMLMKLAQGTGRLIRTKDDTGVVCCLDPRAKNYLEHIKKSLPFVRYTIDLEDVIEFSKSKIIEPTNAPKVLELTPIEEQK